MTKENIAELRRRYDTEPHRREQIIAEVEKRVTTYLAQAKTSLKASKYLLTALLAEAGFKLVMFEDKYRITIEEIAEH